MVGGSPTGVSLLDTEARVSRQFVDHTNIVTKCMQGALTQALTRSICFFTEALVSLQVLEDVGGDIFCCT